MAEGRHANVSEAVRAGLLRLAEDAAATDRPAALGAEGMASGVAEGFDIDAFVSAARAGRGSSGRRWA